MFYEIPQSRHAHRLQLPDHLKPFFSPTPKNQEILGIKNGVIDFGEEPGEFVAFGRSLVLHNAALAMMAGAHFQAGGIHGVAAKAYTEAERTVGELSDPLLSTLIADMDWVQEKIRQQNEALGYLVKPIEEAAGPYANPANLVLIEQIGGKDYSSQRWYGTTLGLLRHSIEVTRLTIKSSPVCILDKNGDKITEYRWPQAQQKGRGLIP